jgi:hypothetical protein
MSRTVIGGGRVNGAAAAKERMADPNWAAPRISMTDANKFAGRDVTFIGETEELDHASGTAVMRCVVSNNQVHIIGVPADAEVSKLNELTCFVEAAGQPVVYVSHGMMNDEFNTQVYSQLLQLIHTHHRDLFF